MEEPKRADIQWKEIDAKVKVVVKSDKKITMDDMIVALLKTEQTWNATKINNNIVSRIHIFLS